MTTINLDNTGKIEIPPEIRQQLGLTAVQSFNLEVSNGCIILQPVGQEATIVRHHESALVIDTPPLGNLEILIDDLREDRIQSQLLK